MQRAFLQSFIKSAQQLRKGCYLNSFVFQHMQTRAPWGAALKREFKKKDFPVKKYQKHVQTKNPYEVLTLETYSEQLVDYQV